MKTLAIANKKGGVAKSTIAVMIAQYLASLGHRVLCIDLDDQGDMTRPLSKTEGALVSTTTAAETLLDPTADVEDAPFVVMPASPELEALEAQADVETRSAYARNHRAFLRRMAERFDFCVVDTNPSRGIRVVSALVACDFALAPFQPNEKSVEGLAKLFNHETVGVFTIKKRWNPNLKFLGILPSMVENTAYHRAYMGQVMAVKGYREQMLALVDKPTSGEHFALIPRRSIVQELEGSGIPLWKVTGPRRSMAKTAWEEIEPVIARIAHLMGAAQ